ncbi:hypothetical protein [Deefgea rivuli]|uniref:hypothetical protein n=1 Tax=Deefgea rivuli TaxID=400948 RepID=UPI0004827020|nr:hypothetical protein [Deefgea rivuli]
MRIDHECLKSILTIFINSEQSEIGINEIASDESLKKFTAEQLKFHLQRMVDSRWIITSSSSKNICDVDHDREINFTPIEYRTTDQAEQYFEASTKPILWSKIKDLAPVTLGTALQVSQELMVEWIKIKIGLNGQ